MSKQRRALLSVSNKEGILELAGSLIELGFEIISTGGTARMIADAGLAVTEVSAVTGFPEILDGRVKTLNPIIHAAILARIELEEHRQTLEQHGIKPIELVVVNLYPFEQTVLNSSSSHEEIIENIDVGGPTMLRAAAKNYDHVTVVVNPGNYPELIRELKTDRSVSRETRFRYAAEAFSHTAYYDALISAYFNSLPQGGSDLYPGQLTLPCSKIQDLRYGENPQQQAAFYASGGRIHGLAAAEQLQGKEMSFNNLNDLNAAWELVNEFEQPTVVAVKHANPCGVGSAESIDRAYALAYEADPVSIFGGVIALNRPVDGKTAEAMSQIFLEVVAAPEFESDALKVFAAKKDVRLIRLKLNEHAAGIFDIKKVSGGLLFQTLDYEPLDFKIWKTVTKNTPTTDELNRLVFAQKVVKHVRSNAIVIAGNNQTLGIGAGQMSRIGAARIALRQAGERAVGAVLGSDAFFPFADTVEEAAAAGIKAIIQPGGSLKDQESIDACNRLGLAMVFTGRRYFRH